jgi:hypothetical protein
MNSTLQLPRFRSYTLPSILPSDIEVVLNLEDHIVTLIVAGDFEAQQIFTAPEMSALLALLEAHPEPCTNAALYATFAEVSLDEAETLLQVVGDTYLDIALRPVRAVLKRCRAKLDALNLGIQPVDSTGYKLFRIE